MIVDQSRDGHAWIVRATDDELADLYGAAMHALVVADPAVNCTEADLLRAARSFSTLGHALDLARRHG